MTASSLAGLLTLTPIDVTADPATANSPAGARPAPAVFYRAVIDPVFTIGPKVHGGTLQMLSAHAAVEALAATRDDVAGAHDLVPVATSSSFLSAPDPGEVTLAVTIRKAGRRVSVVDVDVEQNGRTQVSSSITVSSPDPRGGSYTGDLALRALATEPDSGAVEVRNSPIGEVMHLHDALELWVDSTSIPFARGETGEPVTRLWTRPRDADPDTAFAILAGDISMPVVMNIGRFGWAPTMQLTTYVRRLPAPGWLRIQASSSEIGDGWFEEDHLIIDSLGEVVAQSRQLALLPQ